MLKMKLKERFWVWYQELKHMSFKGLVECNIIKLLEK